MSDVARVYIFIPNNVVNNSSTYDMRIIVRSIVSRPIVIGVEIFCLIHPRFKDCLLLRCEFIGSLVIRVARICTVSHYKTKPLSCASIGGKSEEVKSRSEKLWIGRRKSFLYKVTM
uniref:Uncharacterized protein n=1 Tax=Candidatus Methanogaster sp. ANME-2c ERB4 TaxID=2759911 RepID=A0A7G9YDE3_9EURY|nr:hypothetical protein GMDKAGHH_00024 [Methanosarcinales archaeon ANME-2c ERB4]QNO46027.1 hypothetical protein OOGCPJEC_00012 [Methanosarcinales archaeon ANME-2c ERB4]